MKTLTVLLFFIAALSANPAKGLEVQLKVLERSGITRKSAPVSYGIPFAETDNILSTDQLEIQGVESQMRVLSRYHGTPDNPDKPIRVVLVDFQTDIDSKEQRTFILTTNNKVKKQKTIQLANENSHAIEIDSGPARFFISKDRGNVFQKVVLKDSILLNNPVDDGFVIRYKGKLYSSSQLPPSRVTIEENGPLRCVVKVDGQFADPSGNVLYPPTTRSGQKPDSPLRYTLRYTAYKGKNFLKLEAKLRNENKGWTHRKAEPVHNISIDAAYIQTTLTPTDEPREVRFGDFQAKVGASVFTLLQRELSDGTRPNYRWEYSISKDNKQIQSGDTFSGSIALSSRRNGLAVIDRWFWQNQPIGASISKNRLKMMLWPKVSSPQRILGGIWKTHELLYVFHSGQTSFVEEEAHLRKRLIARPSDQYLARTNFFPFLAPQAISSDFQFPHGERLQTALNLHNNNHLAKFDKTLITNKTYPNTFESLRQGRKVLLSNSPKRFASWYGWLEFGGMPRAANFGYHNQHYDWSYVALLGFLRFDRYDLLDLAEELLQHKLDILFIHDPDATKGMDFEYHGGQRYEADALLSYHYDYPAVVNTAPRKTSHYWTKGVTMQYLLTGQQQFLDVLLQGMEHVQRIHNSPTMRDAEVRNSMRAIDALCNGYLVTGDEKLLHTAYIIFVDNLLSREGGPQAADNASGWLNGSVSDKYDVGVGGDSWGCEPFIKLYEALDGAGLITERDKLGEFMNRWATWLKDKVLTQLPMGHYNPTGTKYFPYIGKNYWSEKTGWYSNIANRAILFPYSDLFAFQYLHSDDTDKMVWLNLARNIFKDYHFYTQNTQGWLKIQFDVLGGVQGFPADSLLASGSFKCAKSITKPMYYLRTEWLQSGTGKEGRDN